MCQSQDCGHRPKSGARSILGTTVAGGALMLLTCAAGPALIALLAGLGIGALAGAGGAALALAACVVVPLLVLRARRGRADRSAQRLRSPA